MAKSHTFSLYLAKTTVQNFESLLTENARDLIKTGQAQQTVSKDFGDEAVLYSFPGQKVIPKWAILIQPAFTPPDNLFSQSSCGIIAFKKNSHIFALTFSYGHVYLDNAQTEAEFGLRVAINAISDKKLRSVEKANLGIAIRDFAQAAEQQDLRTFGFNDALDLIRKVSGHTAKNDFADTITGARSLRFSKKTEISEVPAAALEAIKFFQSKAYKKTAFKVIDFLSPVLDTEVIIALNNAMISSIHSGNDEFEISIPKILPDNIVTFRFGRAGSNSFYPDLSLEIYKESLGENLASLNTEDLKRHDIVAYTHSDSPYHYWPVYDALVGSLVLNDERYAINEGAWYRIGKTIRDAADRKFRNLLIQPDKKLIPLRKISTIPGQGKKPKIGYQSEESYNQEIAQQTDYLCLDQKLIRIDEVPGPGIEVCDLLDIKGRRFIHVKRSSRQSSILSHFFKQGANSAQMLRKFEGFSNKLIEKVGAEYGQEKATELKEALKEKPWTVEFQIADYPRINGEHNIPFFSKLTLTEEARTIEAMGYNIQIGFINLARIQVATLKTKKAA